MRLPIPSELAAVLTMAANRTDLDGLPGTVRIGDRAAPKIVIFNVRTYAGEDNGLAVLKFALDNAGLVPADSQVLFIVARPDNSAPVTNINRLRFPFDMRIPDLRRVHEISAACLSLRPLAVIDLQENSDPETPDGWALGIKGVQEMDFLLECVLAPVTIKGIPLVQKTETGTSPLGVIYPGPVIELLLHPHGKPGGIKAAIGAYLAVLADTCGLTCETPVRPRTQHHMRIVGAIKQDAATGYVIPPPMLVPLVPVTQDTLVAVGDDGTIVRPPFACMLAFSAGKTRIEEGGSDPLFYCLTSMGSASGEIRLPTWFDGL